MAGMVTAAKWSSDLPRGRTHRNTAVLSYEPGTETPAREIVAFLETDGHPAFAERRPGRT
jgi:hypothetical protein